MPKNKKDNFYTWAKQTITYDLAIEAHDVLRGEANQELTGISHQIEYENDTEIHTVKVLNQEGAQLLQKPIGSYITITSDYLKINNHQAHQELADVLAKYLSPLLQLNATDTALVVGLGNYRATPDALGPQTAKGIVATRHLLSNIQNEFLSGVRPVAVLAPGVLGMTGIETFEIISSVCEKINPKVIIACDALAASSPERIGTTIQISDSGIHPGAGLGNKRTAINKENLGIPVISVGIPTVITGQVIAHNVLHAFLQALKERPILKELEQIPSIVYDRVVKDVLEPYQNRLSVTPKEIDDIIQNGAKVIAKGLALALHPNMNPAFAQFYN